MDIAVLGDGLLRRPRISWPSPVPRRGRRASSLDDGAGCGRPFARVEPAGDARRGPPAGRATGCRRPTSHGGTWPAPPSSRRSVTYATASKGASRCTCSSPSDGESAIGWCQWYLCAGRPGLGGGRRGGSGRRGHRLRHRRARAGRPRRGDPTRRRPGPPRPGPQHPGCAVLADPDERNTASRRVLEKNGFELVAVRSLPSEPTDDPVAIYRLARRVVPDRSTAATCRRPMWTNERKSNRRRRDT